MNTKTHNRNITKFVTKIFVIIIMIVEFSKGDTDMEKAMKINPYDIIQEINLVRQFPAAYSQIIKRDYLNTEWQGQEAKKKSAISIYNALIELPQKLPLKPNEKLSEIGYKHALHMASTNELTHEGKNGSNLYTRLNSHGHWYEGAHELLGFWRNDTNNFSAEEIVREWLIDDGHNSRKHRLGMLEDYRGRIGVGIAVTNTHTWVCVLIVVRFDCTVNCNFQTKKQRDTAKYGDYWLDKSLADYKKTFN